MADDTSNAHDETAPETVARPKLATWLFERKLKPAGVASVFGCTAEAVRRYCLPFDHPARARPGDDILGRIVAYTKGEVTAADFYPPHLNGALAEPIEAQP